MPGDSLRVRSAPVHFVDDNHGSKIRLQCLLKNYSCLWLTTLQRSARPQVAHSNVLHVRLTLQAPRDYFYASRAEKRDRRNQRASSNVIVLEPWYRKPYTENRTHSDVKAQSKLGTAVGRPSQSDRRERSSLLR